MENKKEIKTIVWVMWILMAIVGVGLLFGGIQNCIIGGNVVTSIMFIVVGIVLLFIGLTLLLGNANMQNLNVQVPKEVKKVEKKKEKTEQKVK